MVVFFLVQLIGLAMFSIEAADSQLSEKIRKFTGLHSSNKVVNTFSNKWFWFKVLGNFFYLLIPIWGIIYIFFNILRFLIELWECPFCLSFWIGTAFSFFYYDYSLLLSFVFGGVTVFITRLIDKYLNDFNIR